MRLARRRDVDVPTLLAQLDGLEAERDELDAAEADLDGRAEEFAEADVDVRLGLCRGRGSRAGAAEVRGRRDVDERRSRVEAIARLCSVIAERTAADDAAILRAQAARDAAHAARLTADRDAIAQVRERVDGEFQAKRATERKQTAELVRWGLQHARADVQNDHRVPEHLKAAVIAGKQAIAEDERERAARVEANRAELERFGVGGDLTRR